MTRDEEIESFAIASTASWLERNTPLHGLPSDGCIDRYYEDAEACAEMALEARDRRRAARQPAPETPTPALQSLRERVAKTLMDASWPAFDASMADVIAAWDAYDAEVIRKHAATLKERKEKADAR